VELLLLSIGAIASIHEITHHSLFRSVHLFNLSMSHISALLWLFFVWVSPYFSPIGCTATTYPLCNTLVGTSCYFSSAFGRCCRESDDAYSWITTTVLVCDYDRLLGRSFQRRYCEGVPSWYNRCIMREEDRARCINLFDVITFLASLIVETKDIGRL
jgi:hypothetical protein